MLKVTKDKIYLTRGDTARLSVSLTDETGEPYVFSDGDKVFFRLKQSPTAKILLLEKEIPTDSLILELEEADTMNLKFAVYKYEIELVTAINEHYTAIVNADFEIGVELESHNG